MELKSLKTRFVLENKNVLNVWKVRGRPSRVRKKVEKALLTAALFIDFCSFRSFSVCLCVRVSWVRPTVMHLCKFCTGQERRHAVDMSTPLFPGFPPYSLTRGSASGPHWDSSHRPRYKLALCALTIRVHPTIFDLVTPLVPGALTMCTYNAVDWRAGVPSRSAMARF